MSSSLVVRMLDPSDAPLLEEAGAEVFDHATNPKWTAEFIDDPRHHMAIALIDDRVVGMASAIHYVHPDKAPVLWVSEVGVADAHLRKGIGKRLLEVLFQHGRSLGCREAWLGTEEDNTAARGLYAAAGGREETMVYVTFQLDPKP